MTNEKSEQQIENKDMEKQQNRELLRLETGYGQHASFSVNPPAQNGQLVRFIIHCQKQALTEPTIQTKYKILRVMIRNNINLADPEAVKLFIARNKNWSNGHKILAVYAYNEFAKMENIQWTPPYYQNNETLPFVPTEKEVDALISGTSKKVSIALQALKETGFRIGELWNCKWTDLDEEKSTIKCQAEKHGKPREIRITAKLINRLHTTKNQRLHIRQNTPKRHPLDLR